VQGKIEKTNRSEEKYKWINTFRSGRPAKGYNGPMTQQASELLQKALSLSEKERAELAGSLIESLDTTVDEAAETAWNQEIVRRIEDLNSGKAKTIPWEVVRSRISSKVTHRR